MTEESGNSGDGQDDDPTPDPARRDRISSALKQAYDDVANAPLPDRFTQLLDRLKDKKEQ